MLLINISSTHFQCHQKPRFSKLIAVNDLMWISMTFTKVTTKRLDKISSVNNWWKQVRENKGKIAFSTVVINENSEQTSLLKLSFETKYSRMDQVKFENCENNQVNIRIFPPSIVEASLITKGHGSRSILIENKFTNTIYNLFRFKKKYDSSETVKERSAGNNPFFPVLENSTRVHWKLSVNIFHAKEFWYSHFSRAIILVGNCLVAIIRVRNYSRTIDQAVITRGTIIQVEIVLSPHKLSDFKHEKQQNISIKLSIVITLNLNHSKTNNDSSFNLTKKYFTFYIFQVFL